MCIRDRFSFGLGQNVAASVEYDEDRVKSCLEKAGFGARLRGMPEGLGTCLYKDFEENGVEISGGEAQKIALARACLLYTSPCRSFLLQATRIISLKAMMSLHCII